MGPYVPIFSSTEQPCIAVQTAETAPHSSLRYSACSAMALSSLGLWKSKNLGCSLFQQEPVAKLEKRGPEVNSAGEVWEHQGANNALDIDIK